MFDSKTRAITKRAFRRNPFTLIVSDQGDLSDFETTVWRGDKRARRWVAVTVDSSPTKRATILNAEHLALQGDSVIATSADKTVKITGDAVDGSHKAFRTPEGPSFTIDSWRAENRHVMKVMLASTEQSGFTPLLSTVLFRPLGSTTVSTTATDRFVLSRGTLETTSKPVEFSAYVPQRIVSELATTPAWHLTVWESHSVAEFCETGVRVQMMNYETSSAGFPQVDHLFPEYTPSETNEWTVTPGEFAKALRRLDPPRHTPVGISGDGRIASEGSGILRPAGVIETTSSDAAPKWIAFNHEYLTRLLASMAAYRTVRLKWSTRNTQSHNERPIQLEVSPRLDAILVPARGGGSSFEVDATIEL